MNLLNFREAMKPETDGEFKTVEKLPKKCNRKSNEEEKIATNYIVVP